MQEDVVVLKLVVPLGDGTFQEQEVARLPVDQLGKISELLRRLPDDRYRFYYLRRDGASWLILDVMLRDGKPVDPADVAPDRSGHAGADAGGGTGQAGDRRAARCPARPRGRAGPAPVRAGRPSPRLPPPAPTPPRRPGIPGGRIRPWPAALPWRPACLGRIGSSGCTRRSPSIHDVLCRPRSVGAGACRPAASPGSSSMSLCSFCDADLNEVELRDGRCPFCGGIVAWNEEVTGTMMAPSWVERPGAGPAEAVRDRPGPAEPPFAARG